MKNQLIYYEYDHYPPEDYREQRFVHRIYTTETDPRMLARNDPYYMHCLTARFAEGDIGCFKFGVDFAPPHYRLDRMEDSITWVFVLGGKGKLNGVRFEAGDFYYRLPHIRYTETADENEPWQTVWMQLTGAYKYQLIEHLPSCDVAPFLRIREPQNVQKFAELFLYRLTHEIALDETIPAVFSFLLSYVEKPGGEEKNTPLSRDKRIAAEALAYIRQNPAAATVEGLAARFHFEKKYFSRLFFQAEHITPRAAIIREKLHWAAYLLRETQMPIHQVADSVGYAHRNGLLIAFQKMYGQSPADYRKNQGVKHSPNGFEK